MICKECNGEGVVPDHSNLYFDTSRRCYVCDGKGISLEKLLIFLLSKLDITQEQAIQLYKKDNHIKE